ncbi:MAG: hypothetical protein IT285_15905 [Bdellovibrionales bacterium]|nr:hypothetical protein [Bdellovibrionales bacterium]
MKTKLENFLPAYSVLRLRLPLCAPAEPPASPGTEPMLAVELGMRILQVARDCDIEDDQLACFNAPPPDMPLRLRQRPGGAFDPDARHGWWPQGAFNAF